MIRWFAKPHHAARWIPAGLTKWGMEMFVEPRMRHLVAEHLGVGLEELVSHVTLRDDLAADSLDLVELAVALEGEFAIMLPEHILDEVQTYGELVAATGLLIRERCDAEARGTEKPPRMWARIVPAAGASTGTLERTGWLTPYDAETIADDAVRAGNGARLELTVATSTPAGLARAQRRFADLSKLGIGVAVHTGDRPSPPSALSSSPRTTERLPIVTAEPPPL